MKSLTNMRVLFLPMLIPLCAATSDAEYKLVDVSIPVSEGFVWQPEIPADCPFEQSDLFNRIYFTGRYSDYRCGDTFYPSWASDGNLYSPWTDGGTDGVACRSYPGEKARTGHAVMMGEDPLDLVIKNTSAPNHASALPYQGRYPAGSLVHDGIWYYGTYCLGPSPGFRHNGFVYNWPILGPMPGFRVSFDMGTSWHASPHTPDDPLFPEPREYYGPVKMGVPHFVDFGKNMEHSPDGKAYLVAMGAEENDPKPRPCIKPGGEGVVYEICECPDKNNAAHANLSWITADQIYLARVTPSPKTINDIDAYEFFAGHGAGGKPKWSSNFDDVKPLIEWNNNMGCVTVTYAPKLKKYLMCVTDGWPTMAKMDSYILEADELTGPWKIITYMKGFGEQAYFLNFPTKFINDNGRDMWLCYSANFSPRSNGCDLKFIPEGGRYGLCLHEMRFLSKEEKDPVEPKVEKVDIFAGNLAPEAEVSVSSTHPGYSPKALIDQQVDGYPRKVAAEWASKGEKTGAWVKLEWNKNKRVSRVLLFDRPNTLDHVRSGILTFSDGTSIRIEKPLPDSAKKGLEVKFKSKKITWLKFEVTSTSASSPNIGLSEIAVFK